MTAVFDDTGERRRAMSGHFAEWIAGLGPGIANHLWQSTAFAAGAWLLTLALRQNQARVRYAVWLAASIKFLVPFSLLIAAGNLLPQPKQAVAPAVYSAMDVVEEPFAFDLQAAAPVVDVRTLRERMEAVLPAGLAAVWLAGAGVVLVVWARRWHMVWRTGRGAVAVSDGREWEILRRVAGDGPGAEAPNYFGATMPGLKSRPISETKASAGVPRVARSDDRASPGMTAVWRAMARSHPSRRDGWGTDLWRFGRRGIELRLSEERMEPGIFGIFRPVLVWPRELSARLDDEHIAAILAHEMAHVRRRDNLTAALHMMVETFFWFHPLVWWMERCMVKEREQACDEAVISIGENKTGEQTGAQDYAGVYAEALLKTCRFCIESPLVCVAGVTGADLKQRVLEIVTGRALVRMSWAKKALLAVAAICVIAAPVVLGQAKAAQRLMLAAINVAPRPVQAVAKTMMAVQDTPGTGEIAEVQGTSPSQTEASTGNLEFAVATIRPHSPGGMCTGRDTADGFAASCQSARSLIMSAYELAHQQQVVGLPAWTASGGFDVVAKMDDDTAAALARMTPQQQRAERPAMLRSLLAQRFGLKIHRETRELPVYVMKVTTPGKLKLSDPKMHGQGTFSNDKFSMVAMPISNLVNNLGNIVGRMVIDQTGLTGTYDLTLEWAPQGADASDPRPSIFAALEEQLGLKLVPTKGPVEVIVVDQIEKPSIDGAEASDTSMQPSAPAKLAFSVASIRPSPPDAHSLSGPHGTAEDFSATMATVESMIGYAYNVPWVLGMAADPLHFYLPHVSELMGGPDWIRSDKYDLKARLDGPELEAWNKLPKDQQKEQLRLMMRALLADRFKLVMRQEKRELPVYALIVANGGPKLKVSTGPPPGLNDGSDPAKPFDTSKPYVTRWGGGDRGWIKGRDGKIDELVTQLWTQRELAGRKVLDRTGLTGRYDIDLKWASVDDPRNPDGPSLFTAIQEQLGLKLDPVKAPVDVLVIDHIERPSEN
jgi:bla regulator protein blaR1